MMRKEPTVKPKPRNLRVFKKREEKKKSKIHNWTYERQSSRTIQKRKSAHNLGKRVLSKYKTFLFIYLFIYLLFSVWMFWMIVLCLCVQTAVVLFFSFCLFVCLFVCVCESTYVRARRTMQVRKRIIEKEG